jgi:hypothetical protein
VERLVKLVLLVAGSSDAHRSFHLAAGVGEVVEPGGPLEADWVIEGEPDEFWWPRAGGSLEEILDRVPAEYSEVEAVVRPLLAVQDGEPVYRLAPRAPVDGTGPERTSVRRGHPSGRTLRGWYPIEVLRIASEQLLREDVDRGLAAGTLVEDRRLVDALGALAAGAPLSFPRPSVLEDAQFAADLAVLGEADVVRAQRRLDGLEERVAAVESLTPLRLERRLRSLVRRRR